MTDFPATPPLFVSDAEVRASLSSLDVRAALTAMFGALGRGNAIQPPQTLTPFPARAGDFITYQGVLADARVFGAKLSPYIVTGDKPIVTAWTALMSMDSGQPLMWCDSGQLTVERTAGTTALAVDLLAPRAARRLAVIGSGAAALAHLRHVLPLRDWAEVHIYSPSLQQDAALRATVQDIAGAGRATFAAAVADCVRDADVIMLCTSSAGPVLLEADLTQPALITSISTNAARAHEIPPAMLPAMDVYCDYKRTTPAVAGEMTLAAELHGWSPEQVAGDLPDLVNGNCVLPGGQRHVFFRSVGLGLEDIAVAHALYQLRTGLR